MRSMVSGGWHSDHDVWVGLGTVGGLTNLTRLRLEEPVLVPMSEAERSAGNGRRFHEDPRCVVDKATGPRPPIDRGKLGEDDAH